MSEGAILVRGAWERGVRPVRPVRPAGAAAGGSPPLVGARSRYPKKLRKVALRAIVAKEGFCPRRAASE